MSSTIEKAALLEKSPSRNMFKKDPDDAASLDIGSMSIFSDKTETTVVVPSSSSSSSSKRSALSQMKQRTLALLGSRGNMKPPELSWAVLSGMLVANLVESNFPNGTKSYWPVDVVHKLVNEETVRRGMSKAYRKRVDNGLVQFIVNEAPMLFTLVLTSIPGNQEMQVEMLEWFRQHGIHDGAVSSIVGGRSVSEVLSATADKQLSFWTGPYYQDICKNQWKIFVPVIGGKTGIRKLRKEIILPFTRVEDPHTLSTTVNKVKVHRGYFDDGIRPQFQDRQSNSPHTERVVSIKEISVDDDRDEKHLRHEMETLLAMGRRQEIVRLLAAFELEDIPNMKRYFLVYEWIAGGSLEDLFKTHKNPSLDGKLAAQTVKQLWGLATGLQFLHYKAGIIHGDLKSSNILWSKPPTDVNSPCQPTNGDAAVDIFAGSTSGMLKIGDWGLAKYHRDSEFFVGGHRRSRYQPPELYLPEILGLDTASSARGSHLKSYDRDTWSMGCIMLEMLIWLIYGWDELQAFRNDLTIDDDGDNGFLWELGPPTPCHHQQPRPSERSTETITHKRKIQIKPVVYSWISHLAEHRWCSAYSGLGPLLELVDRNLLVQPGENVTRMYDRTLITWCTGSSSSSSSSRSKSIHSRLTAGILAWKLHEDMGIKKIPASTSTTILTWNVRKCRQRCSFRQCESPGLEIIDEAL